MAWFERGKKMRTTIAASCAAAACLLAMSPSFSPAQAEIKPREECAKWETTKPPRLIEACSETIASDGKAAWAYLNRGIAYAATGKADEELADYSKAIELDPKLVNAWQNRGVAYYDRGDFAAAAGDFAQVASLKRDPYATLLLYLAGSRSGSATAAGDLEAYARTLGAAGNWPFALFELYLGKKSVPATLRAAVTKEHRCEAQFYVGEFFAIANNKVAAERPLRTAAGLCGSDTIEFNSALAELKRLGFSTTPAKPRPPRPPKPPARAPAAAPAPAR